MKKRRTPYLGLGLIGISALLHLLHLLIFRDPHHLVIYLWGDIAFIPLEVFFVSLVLDKFIEKREKDQLKSKANMMVGLFCQELGSGLLAMLSGYDRNLDRDHLEVDMERVYRNLATGWVHYLVYLKGAYPYLYASAVRTNPFM